MAPNDLMKALGERWNALSAGEKVPFEDKEWADKKRYALECSAAGIDPEEAKARRRKHTEGEAEGEEGGSAKRSRTSRKKKKKGPEAGAEAEGEEAELLPWAVPPGYVVAGRPAAEALEPSRAAAKTLLGRSMMYHWQVWCTYSSMMHHGRYTQYAVTSNQ